MNQTELFSNTIPPFYYNTTGLKGEELKAKRKKMTQQDEDVLKLFQSFQNWQELFTPWQVLELMEKSGKPIMITSVRRSMNTLTGLGYLEKTKERRRSGPADEYNFCWKLTPKGYKRD